MPPIAFTNHKITHPKTWFKGMITSDALSEKMRAGDEDILLEQSSATGIAYPNTITCEL